jgi:hypothetical protein
MTEQNLWFYCGIQQMDPYCFSLNEEDLKIHLDKLHKSGCNQYPYEEEKARGFIQQVTIPLSKWQKIIKNGHLCLRCEHTGSGLFISKVVALSDNKTDFAREVSKHWESPISAKALLKLGNPRLNILHIDGTGIIELY